MTVKIREVIKEVSDYHNNQKKDILIYNLNCHDNPNKYFIHKSKYQNVYKDDNNEELNFTILM